MSGLSHKADMRRASEFGPLSATSGRATRNKGQVLRNRERPVGIKLPGMLFCGLMGEGVDALFPQDWR